MNATRKVKIKRRGNRTGIWFFKTAVRLTGLRGAYGLLYFVCAYYLLFDRAAVRSARAYIVRRFPEKSRAAQRLAIYRLFIEQGKNLIDRHAMIAGAHNFDLQINGFDKIPAETGKGFILLTSHLGNWQIVMQALQKMDRTVHLLMRPEDNAALQEAMQVDAESSRIKVISPEQHLGGVVEMMQALERGDVVSIMGDRTYQADGVPVDFLGAPAFFPYSAFQLAASAGCPLVILLSAKTGKNSYTVDLPDVLHPVWTQRNNKREQMQGWVRKYAQVLETYLREYPLQYFIFHDLWEEARQRQKKGAE
jgi:predicted LPLAT superfamily acyltransferase